MTCTLQIRRLPRAPIAKRARATMPAMSKKSSVSNEEILRAVVSVQAQVRGLKSYVEEKLETVKEEIIERLTPTEKAVDTDSEMLVDHERRIRVLEKPPARA